MRAVNSLFKGEISLIIGLFINQTLLKLSKPYRGSLRMTRYTLSRHYFVKGRMSGMGKAMFQAAAQLHEGTKVTAKARGFEMTIDEPESLGGTNTGMNPVEAVLCALGGCQAIVARVYAGQFGITFEDLWVEIEGELDPDGFMNKSDVRPGFSDIRYTMHIKTDAPKEKLDEFARFVESKCPVGDSLEKTVNMILHDVVIEQ